MAQITITLDKKQNKLVEMYKAEHGIGSKARAIEAIVSIYLDEDI